MPYTRIQDVIVPAIFTPYVINRTAELSELALSGIISRNPLLDQLVSGGGTTIKMPFWNDLAGEDQVLDDTDPIETEKITAGADIAALLIRANGWSSHELAGALAGNDPQAAIANLVAAWWVRKEQNIIISALNGVFASPSMSDLVNDTSAVGGKPITANLVLDSKQLLGDAYGQLTAIAMHSMTYTRLQKEGMIMLSPSNVGDVRSAGQEPSFPTYLGYRVVIDDGMPVDPDPAGDGSEPPLFTTYLFSNGVIARGEGTPVALTPVEVDRDSAMSTDVLFHRRAIVLHPLGVKWKGTSVSKPTPTNADLANGANWERVYEKKRIGIVKIVHTLEA